MKFYKRDPDRALAGMNELTLRQRGAYNSILDLLYSRDGDVPDDDARVAKMICCHWREWKAVKEELIALGKIWLEGGKIRAKRVQETLKEAADFSQEQRKKATSGWQKRKTASENNEPEMPPGNALTPTATPTPTATIALASDGAREGDGEGGKVAKPPKADPPARKAMAATILADKAFTVSEWEDKFLSNIAGLTKLSAEQRDKFAAIEARWKGRQANAPPVVPKIAVADGSPEMRAWEANGKRYPRTDVRLDDGRLVRGWYFPSKTPPAQERAA